jgi:hypothetical protein
VVGATGSVRVGVCVAAALNPSPTCDVRLDGAIFTP